MQAALKWKAHISIKYRKSVCHKELESLCSTQCHQFSYTHGVWRSKYTQADDKSVDTVDMEWQGKTWGQVVLQAGSGIRLTCGRENCLLRYLFQSIMERVENVTDYWHRTEEKVYYNESVQNLYHHCLTIFFTCTFGVFVNDGCNLDTNVFVVYA